MMGSMATFALLVMLMQGTEYTGSSHGLEKFGGKSKENTIFSLKLHRLRENILAIILKNSFMGLSG